MTKSELIERAYALRQQGEFQSAYDLFLSAAKNTDDILEKARILLNAATNLTQLHRFDAARTGLTEIKGLLSHLNTANLGSIGLDEVYRVIIGVEIEHSEILATEGKLEQAIEKLTQILHDFKVELEEPGLMEAYDEVRSRRAFFLIDIGHWDKALPILLELKARQSENSLFLFSLGFCYQQANKFEEARRLFERTLNLKPPPGIDFQAHCCLGMTLYELGEFAQAKLELETGARNAPAAYIQNANLWEWLENVCSSLGLKREADHYAHLAKPS